MCVGVGETHFNESDKTDRGMCVCVCACVCACACVCVCVCVCVEGGKRTRIIIKIYLLDPTSLSWIVIVAAPGDKVTPAALVAKTTDKDSAPSTSVSSIVCTFMHISCWSFPGPKDKEAEKES